MGTGFLRRVRAPLAGALLLAGSTILLAAAPGPSGAARTGGTTWWEVRLTVAAAGEYAVEGGRAPVRGEYTCRASWEGRLEVDGEDFLLIHLRSAVQEWRIRESAGPAATEDVIESGTSPRPSLHMNCIIKDGTEVEFVFDLGGVPVPLHESPFVVTLEMPRSSSRLPGLPGRGYGDHVRRGSCRIVVPETDILETVPERRFAWEWGQEKRYDRDGRTYVVTQGHRADVTVSLIVH